MKTYDLTLNRPMAPKLGPPVSSLKDRAPIEHVVERLGLVAKYGMVRTGSSIQGDCPPGHPSTNHQCFSVDVEDNLFHCFHCAESGDVVSLVELVQKSGFMYAVNWLVDRGFSGDHTVCDPWDQSSAARAYRIPFFSCYRTRTQKGEGKTD